MAEIRQLIENLKKIQDGLQQVLLDSASIIAHDALGLAEQSILEKGFGEQYSDKAIPSYFLKGKEINAGGLSYLQKVEDDPEVVANWKGFRKAQGLQTGFVDLSYSRTMWQGLRPDEPQNEGSRYFCNIGHNNVEGQKKMNWNFARYGDFIGKGLKGQEDILQEVAEENVRMLLDQML